MTVEMRMQAGTTAYYDVVVMRKTGNPIVGRSVRDKREAEWLAEILRNAAGLDSAEAASTRPLLRA